MDGQVRSHTEGAGPDIARDHRTASISGNHRARHIANAREWLRREAVARKYYPGRDTEGYLVWGGPIAIHTLAEREAKAANVDVTTLKPAVLQ